MSDLGRTAGFALKPKYGWCFNTSHLNCGEKKEIPGLITQPESVRGRFENESTADGGTGKEFFIITVSCCNAESATGIAIVSAGV